jgi:chromosome segregation ATPase
MLPFSKHIGSLEDALDKQEMLELDLRAKIAEISAYEIGRQKMLEGFAENKEKSKDKESKLAEDLDDANDKIKSLEGQVAALKRGSVSNELFSQSFCRSEMARRKAQWPKVGHSTVVGKTVIA